MKTHCLHERNIGIKEGSEDEPISLTPDQRRGIFGVCCPAGFNTPTRRSGNTRCPDNTNSLCPPAGRAKAGEVFYMRASFSSGEGCACSRCEYRQYVRGEFKINGKRCRHRLVNPRTGRRIFMSKSSYREDAVRVTWPSGPITRYGDRNARRSDIDRYEPDQHTGCAYQGIDFPGILDLNPGDRFVIDLKFEGRIIETGTGRIMRRRRWRVYYAGVWPAAPAGGGQ